MKKNIGYGAQNNLGNRFSKVQYEANEYSDIPPDEIQNNITYTEIHLKTIVNKVHSADLSFEYSMNPYQGCEHGCAYCYARPTHQYWGLDAGTDFERKLLVKTNAANLLDAFFRKRGYQPKTIMLSGNTDCYQPIESQLKITRKLLEKCLEFKHPVGIITKNALILRDLDILTELNKNQLVSVSMSIPTINEELRRKMEPRTSTSMKKLGAIQKLSDAGIPVNALIAPIIPGLNSDEILPLMKAVAERGAQSFAYNLVRLNDEVAPIFTEWLNYHYPNKVGKVLNGIKSMQGGKLHEYRSDKRNVGSGEWAKLIHDTFTLGKKKYFPHMKKIELNARAFIVRPKGQLSLFD